MAATRKKKGSTSNLQKTTDISSKQNQEKEETSFWVKYKSLLELIYCFVGIYASYLIFGLIQEEVNLTRYGPEQKKFKAAFFLVFCQCLAGAIVARIMLFVNRAETDQTPMLSYIPVAFSYVSAMVCSNLSIQYIDYPTMTLAKSCKPIPGVLMARILYGKKQSWQKYVSVFLVVLGIVVFSFGDPNDSKKGANASSMEGIALVLISLFFDGITGPTQDEITKKYKPTTYHLMFFLNLWACAFLLLVLVITGEGLFAIRFCLEYPQVLLAVIAFSVAGSIGQIFIYFCIVRFGSLACTLITTTRKFVSILASVIYYQHPTTWIQWFGVVVVFFGLGFETFAKNQQKDHHIVVQHTTEIGTEKTNGNKSQKEKKT